MTGSAHGQCLLDTNILIPFGAKAARTYGRVSAAVVSAGRKPRRRVADLIVPI
jgi:hypothetical protein